MTRSTSRNKSTWAKIKGQWCKAFGHRMHYMSVFERRMWENDHITRICGSCKTCGHTDSAILHTYVGDSASSLTELRDSMLSMRGFADDVAENLNKKPKLRTRMEQIWYTRSKR